MSIDEHKFTMSEQVEILCALDTAIAENTDLVNKLNAAGLHELVKPRMQALTRLENIRQIIGECMTLTATKPFVRTAEAGYERENDPWSNGQDEDSEEPPF